jgi:hypothetical protein
VLCLATLNRPYLDESVSARAGARVRIVERPGRWIGGSETMLDLRGPLFVTFGLAGMYFSVRAGQNMKAEVKDPFYEMNFRGALFRAPELFTERGLRYRRRALQCVGLVAITWLTFLFG